MDIAHVLQRQENEHDAPAAVWPESLGWIAAAGVALGLGFVAGLPLQSLLTAPLTVVVFGSFRANLRLRDAGRRRRRADAWIEHATALPGRYRWRVEELTCPRERRLLARSVRGVVADLSPGRLPGASPLNRVALRPHADLLAALADRLSDLDRPVVARGILGVHRLVTDPSSVLYARPELDECGASAASNDVARVLRAAIERLEPVS